MSLVNTLKKTLSIVSTPPTYASVDESQLNFIKSRKTIRKELALSKENGSLVGVYCKALGEGMFLVGINNIESDGPVEVVVFETYDQSGMILNRTRVSIDEIKMICPLYKKYLNPILEKIQIA